MCFPGFPLHTADAEYKLAVETGGNGLNEHHHTGGVGIRVGIHSIVGSGIHSVVGGGIRDECGVRCARIKTWGRGFFQGREYSGKLSESSDYTNMQEKPDNEHYHYNDKGYPHTPGAIGSVVIPAAACFHAAVVFSFAYVQPAAVMFFTHDLQ